MVYPSALYNLWVSYRGVMHENVCRSINTRQQATSSPMMYLIDYQNHTETLPKQNRFKNESFNALKYIVLQTLLQGMPDLSFYKMSIKNTFIFNPNVLHHLKEKRNLQIIPFETIRNHPFYRLKLWWNRFRAWPGVQVFTNWGRLDSVNNVNHEVLVFKIFILCLLNILNIKVWDIVQRNRVPTCALTVACKKVQFSIRPRLG